jgi:acyl-CoA thioester hydrolase
MALKDDPWRLAVAAYPARHRLATRYGDMDANAHLNNVAIARLVEETRVRTLSALRGDTAVAGPAALMIAHVGIDYLAEGQYPADVEAGLAVTSIGRSSFGLAMGLFQQGRPFALAESVMVHLGPGRAPAPIGKGLRDRLAALAPHSREDMND